MLSTELLCFFLVLFVAVLWNSLYLTEKRKVKALMKIAQEQEQQIFIVKNKLEFEIESNKMLKREYIRIQDVCRNIIESNSVYTKEVTIGTPIIDYCLDLIPKQFNQLQQTYVTIQTLTTELEEHDRKAMEFLYRYATINDIKTIQTNKTKPLVIQTLDFAKSKLTPTEK